MLLVWNALEELLLIAIPVKHHTLALILCLSIIAPCQQDALRIALFVLAQLKLIA
jgi:hypothetical protein